ncbi:MAG: DUF4388 domain-containing protein [Desulfuromonadales bacterium]|nr:DUF4388 domain-containing protein [Desulfuromonadales bacterium]
MSFTGDLEHLPIVDVIQLLHATRKSGTLGVQGRRGECELVFDNGYIVSASNSQNMVRIGQILVERGAISSAVLEQTLQEQSRAGNDRRPLMAMLHEGGKISREEAAKGLETLIELTIVDILTWTTGTFSLDVDKVVLADEYRYFPEKLQQPINVNTQNVLMDALRIYDEKKRDGTLMEELGEAEAPPVAAEAAGRGGGLSANDLGLDGLEFLERRIPEVFSSLADFPAGIGSTATGAEGSGSLTPEERERLRTFLQQFTIRQVEAGGSRPPQAVILFSRDELLRYAVVTICRHAGILVFTTDDGEDLAPIIEQSLARRVLPVLVFDAPQSGAGALVEEQLVALRQQQQRCYPQLPIFQFAPPYDLNFSWQALSEGVRAVYPRPLQSRQPDSFIDDFTRFLESFRTGLDVYGDRSQESFLPRLQADLAGLRPLREAPEIALALLKSVAGLFERSLTLVVGPTELMAERGIGVAGEGTPSLGFRIPLAQPSVFRQVIEEKRTFFGPCEDRVLQEHLFAAIGAPLRPTVLLLPMRSRDKTVWLTYADFGAREVAPIPLALLEILAGQASLVLENAFYRKKLESSRGGK